MSERSDLANACTMQALQVSTGKPVLARVSLARLPQNGQRAMPMRFPATGSALGVGLVLGLGGVHRGADLDGDAVAQHLDQRAQR